MGTSDASVTNKKYVDDSIETERERALRAELDENTRSKLVRLVSTLDDNQIDALIAFAQSLTAETAEQ